ncbi:hypothetical protein ACQ4M3_23190 [Leptolyngbya sp. AN03gr2]|uniref:hypothetical protein n=1 Tax=unclassified Leptolyngbya TaxID=2650499 RepID=UPI003D31260B
MSTKFYKQAFSLLGFTAAIVGLSSLPAQAQTATPSGTAVDLQAESTTSPTQSSTIAQGISPGRATRAGSSYVGIGGNIGIGGNSALGRGNFSAFSKVGLTNNLSARPGVVIGNNTTFLIPLTVDFPVSAVDGGGRVSAAPYIGAGAAVTVGSDSRSRVRPMVTGGVDVPLTPELTATAGVNAAFSGRTDVGVLLGVGYNF